MGRGYGRQMRRRGGDSGPLAGLRVVEIAGLAPAPFAATMLADLGADVVRIDRPAGTDNRTGPTRAPVVPPLSRSRRRVALDLKQPEDVAGLLRLIDHADVLIEGFRPGVCERLGFGPDVACARNPRLVFGRLSGWGQDGPWAPRAGHDLTYLALSGALQPIGAAGTPPLPPLNYVADFGGGGMLLAFGVLAALWERERSGRGQVVDAAMVEGAGLMTLLLHGLLAGGVWSTARGTNLLDGSAPFYTTYRCSDGRHLAVAALEPEFYAELLRGLGLDGADLPAQYDRARWPVLRRRLAGIIGTLPRDEWAARFAGRDACVAPVLSPTEAPRAAHLAARASFVDVDGLVQPAPAPRFGRTANPPPQPAPTHPVGVEDVLSTWTPVGRVGTEAGRPHR